MRMIHGVIAAAFSMFPAAAVLMVAAPVAAQSVPNFRSDAALRRFLTDEEGGLRVPPPPPHAPPPAPSPPPPPGAQPPPPNTPSITNTQVADIDEGGIVKVSGEHLVILRRGRLFSVSMADGGLRSVDAVDAFPPGLEPGRSWYDELLVIGDLVTVIGYSSRGGTEVNRFRLSPDGRFAFVDSHLLRASDYYSYSNYASRLIGTELIVYSPVRFSYQDRDPLDGLPGISRWVPGGGEPQFRRIASSRDVHIPAAVQRAGAEKIELMHTVYRCDLAAPELQCRATVVLGDRDAIFYVTHNAAYLWNDVHYRVGDHAYVYRLPHDGGRVTAAQVWEAPTGQYGFRANARSGRLDMLMMARGRTPEWGAEHGGAALLRLPMSRFGDGSRLPERGDYQFLAAEGLYTQLVPVSRFVGDWAFYSTAESGYGDPPVRARPARLVAVPPERGEPVVFDIETGVERVESIGGDVLIAGGWNEVVFTTLDMSSGAPRLGPRHVQPQASPTESRSHAFFFRPDGVGDNGLMGLPVLSHLPPEGAGGEWRSHAAMLFLRRQDGQLTGLGRLDSDTAPRLDDGCRVSCVDWYGNARPIFLNGRVFALMGYEIVEGRVGEGGVTEIARADFTPRAPN